jgi:hypothetical protein
MGGTREGEGRDGQIEIRDGTRADERKVGGREREGGGGGGVQ